MTTYTHTLKLKDAEFILIENLVKQHSETNQDAIIQSLLDKIDELNNLVKFD